MQYVVVSVHVQIFIKSAVFYRSLKISQTQTKFGNSLLHVQSIYLPMAIAKYLMRRLKISYWNSVAKITK